MPRRTIAWGAGSAHSDASADVGATAGVSPAMVTARGTSETVAGT